MSKASTTTEGLNTRFFVFDRTDRCRLHEQHPKHSPPERWSLKSVASFLVIAPMDFSELFTQNAREVLALARSKWLVSYFDYRGPLVEVARNDAGLRSGIHRVLRGLIDCLDTGTVTFNADVQASLGGNSKALICAGGTGTTNPEAVYEVWRRLALQPVLTAEPGSRIKFCRAEGKCPTTGGKVAFVDAGADGLLISLDIQLPAMEPPTSHPLPDACGAEAWLVSEVRGGLDSVRCRLQRQGWRVKLFGSLGQVSSLLVAEDQRTPSLPSVLIVDESSPDDLAELEQFALLAPSVWTVIGVVMGSPTLKLRGSTQVDIRVLPFSPLEIDAISAHVDLKSSSVESRNTPPPPLFVQDRKVILVVDDVDVNRELATALLEVLGYDVVVAGDGVEALDACRRAPPDLVLMDIEMPVMGGLEAARRLVQLQHIGTLPPFPIVAATSAFDRSLPGVCLALGMSGYLNKPLGLTILADEIHRVLPTRPAAR